MDMVTMSDREVVREIGRRLRRRRLERNWSQEQVAERAGLTRVTIARVEKGTPASLLTLIQILRALDVIEELDGFLPDPGISPLELARMKGRERQRASGPRDAGDRGDS